MMKELNPISINPIRVVFLFLAMACMSACDFMLGTRQDDTVDEIFEQGAIDPTAVQSVVGYGLVLPVWDQFMSPTDVWVGYDEMVYVTDAQGVHVLDLKGERFQTIPIPGAT
ncbi:MAG: hypothetical protein ACKO7V_00785, partial [Bacteroidota bacterium]